MSRLPIRARLALTFALATAVVLVGLGALLTDRLRATLDEVIDDGLAARTAELAPRIAAGEDDVAAGVVADPGERFVQVLDDRGAVVSASPGLDDRPLVEDLGATPAPRKVELEEWPGVDGRARIFGTPVESATGTRYLLVGTSLEDRDETVRGFLIELAIIGPIALVLVSALGYALATAALRPVEGMRREAEAFSASEPGRRLTLPASRDEITRLGETLNELLDRLESALERERGFVADASHELRTPLTVLTTELELALRRPRSEAELERALRSAAGEADRLARLADDLLLLARSDRGRLSLHRERVQTRALLERVAGRAADRARAAGCELAVDGTGSHTIDGDSILLEQAIGNLVENALRHGRGRIRLSEAENGARVELHVTDEGDGFPPAFLPRAFDRFTRADDARARGGAGLGLTIAAAVAEAHRGSIHARNRDEGGADVWLSLPLASPRAAR